MAGMDDVHFTCQLSLGTHSDYSLDDIGTPAVISASHEILFSSLKLYPGGDDIYPISPY